MLNYQIYDKAGNLTAETATLDLATSLSGDGYILTKVHTLPKGEPEVVIRATLQRILDRYNQMVDMDDEIYTQERAVLSLAVTQKLEKLKKLRYVLKEEQRLDMACLPDDVRQRLERIT